MKLTSLLIFACCVAAYLILDWRSLGRSDPATRGMAIGICAAALLIWTYLMSQLPLFYPSSVLDQWLDPLVPFSQATQVRGPR